MKEFGLFTVADSIIKVEYIVASLVDKEAVWIRRFTG